MHSRLYTGMARGIQFFQVLLGASRNEGAEMKQTSSGKQQPHLLLIHPEFCALFDCKADRHSVRKSLSRVHTDAQDTLDAVPYPTALRRFIRNHYV